MGWIGNLWMHLCYEHHSAVLITVDFSWNYSDLFSGLRFGRLPHEQQVGVTNPTQIYDDLKDGLYVWYWVKLDKLGVFFQISQSSRYLKHPAWFRPSRLKTKHLLTIGQVLAIGAELCRVGFFSGWTARLRITHATWCNPRKRPK